MSGAWVWLSWSWCLAQHLSRLQSGVLWDCSPCKARQHRNRFSSVSLRRLRAGLSSPQPVDWLLVKRPPSVLCHISLSREQLTNSDLLHQRKREAPERENEQEGHHSFSQSNLWVTSHHCCSSLHQFQHGLLFTSKSLGPAQTRGVEYGERDPDCTQGAVVEVLLQPWDIQGVQCLTAPGE